MTENEHKNSWLDHIISIIQIIVGVLFLGIGGLFLFEFFSGGI